MVQRIWLIASNTFVETIRQPVFCLILLIAGYLIGFSPCLAMFTMLENLKLVQDMGLATLFLAGLALAVFSSYTVVTQEIEKRTVLTLMAKPVGRVDFVFGKFLGIAAGIAVAAYLLTTILLFTLRVGVKGAAYSEIDHVALWFELGAVLASVLLALSANYFFDKPFTSSVVLYGLIVFTLCLVVAGFVDSKGRLQPFFANMDGQTAIACGVLLMGVLVLTAAALAVATRANFGVTLTVCVVLFLLGLVSDYLFGRHASTSLMARIAYAALPNLQVFWLSDALAAKKTIPLGYVCRVAGYASIYSFGLVLAAASLFQEREIS